MRFSLYHLTIAADPEDPMVNIGAKSLSGEGYRGHVFWDTEVLMLPFFIFNQAATVNRRYCIGSPRKPGLSPASHATGNGSPPPLTATTGRTG